MSRTCPGRAPSSFTRARRSCTVRHTTGARPCPVGGAFSADVGKPATDPGASPGSPRRAPDSTSAQSSTPRRRHRRSPVWAATSHRPRPREAAHLLRGRDYPDEVVAAGVLHDVVEDARVTSVDPSRRWGRVEPVLANEVVVDRERLSAISSRTVPWPPSTAATS